MASARAATAAAFASLAAVAAWFAPLGPSGLERFAVGTDATPAPPAAFAWQATTTKLDRVPAALSGTSGAPIAVIDTGADLAAEAFAARPISTYNVLTRTADVTDSNGHGTFVASLAAATNSPLLIVKAGRADGTISAASEASAIRYAVNHGARVINLSFAGPTTSPLERAAVRYAVARGVLMIAAAGNTFVDGNPVEYPAALLQPVGSNGRGGVGLVVGASTRDGQRASFSSSGSWISLAAPGESVLGSLANTAAGATASGALGYASGTSYAAPQVAAAAALVWGVDPMLTARQVARILEETASSGAGWTPDLGYGVIDVSAAVAEAQTLAG
jgi:subtilisin family serine protease